MRKIYVILVEYCMKLTILSTLNYYKHVERAYNFRINSGIGKWSLVAASTDSVPSSYLVPIGTTFEIFNEGGIKIISLSNIRPIIIYFHSSQCRLIPYLHQRPIFFKTNSSIVAILELIRGAQCLIEVIRSFGEEM
jgi:hypothetical protein